MQGVKLNNQNESVEYKNKNEKELLMRSQVCLNSPYSNHYLIFGFVIISNKHSNCFSQWRTK